MLFGGMSDLKHTQSMFSIRAVNSWPNMSFSYLWTTRKYESEACRGTCLWEKQLLPPGEYKYKGVVVFLFGCPLTWMTYFKARFHQYGNIVINNRSLLGKRLFSCLSGKELHFFLHRRRIKENKILKKSYLYSKFKPKRFKILKLVATRHAALCSKCPAGVVYPLTTWHQSTAPTIVGVNIFMHFLS